MYACTPTSMCAPSSKPWLARARCIKWVLSALQFFLLWYVGSQCIIAYEVDYFIQGEVAYLTEGVIAPYMESKWTMSEETQWEIQALQTSVAALASHDLAVQGAPFATAAFDLHASDSAALARGIAD